MADHGCTNRAENTASRKACSFCLPCNDLESNLHSCVCRGIWSQKIGSRNKSSETGRKAERPEKRRESGEKILKKMKKKESDETEDRRGICQYL